MLSGKRITLGVSGGIAAYKAADLASNLSKLGARVHVVLTKSASRFISALTFEALTGNTVHSDLFESSSSFKIPHIELAAGSNLVLIAPATANILGKLAHGLADDLLSTLVLAAKCPVLICPAMNFNMYDNPMVQKNISTLADAGFSFVEPGFGHLACGTTGRGRLGEVKDIVNKVIELLPPSGDLSGLKVLVTAGGTREVLDPVRYLTNHSSGKMGYALARAAFNRGAEVTLISSPTALEPPPGVRYVEALSAADMLRAVLEYYPGVHLVIKAAAVADYRPVRVDSHKIKKAGDTLVLELEKTPDILYELGKLKSPGVTMVGFAAETQDLEQNAREKLRKKNLDLVVANDVTLPGAGFGSDTNIVKLIYPDGTIKPLEIMDKLSLAHRILDEVLIIRQD